MKIRKRDRTRERLLTAAQNLLLEGGYGSLGIQQLTERAEVAIGTIYNYFRTREEVADGVIELLVSAHLRSITHITEGLTDPAAIVAASVRQTLYWMHPNSAFGRLLFVSGLPLTRYAYQVRQGFIRDMKLGMASGRFNVANDSVTASMIAGGVFAVLLDLFLGQIERTVIDSVAETSLTILGIDPKEAKAIANMSIQLLDPPTYPLSAIEYLQPLDAT
ncbi:MAG: TetR/AcrR family transcriptional regulator [Hahellaceae bacterium]|nr:TetR/AcrR family transcriptional regulator [Hahellaceae bacterium]